MKLKDIHIGRVGRYAAIVLTGYIAALVFVLSFLAAVQAKDRFGLSSSFSEATALVIAVILTLPILLPLAWNRLTKVKVGELEIDLVEVGAQSRLALVDELSDVQRLAMGPSAIPNLIDKLAIAISEAETTNVVEVEFSWSTRLYLLAALAEDYTSIRQLIFLESRPDRERIYVGNASPAKVRHALGADNPKLVEAYQAAKKMAPDPDAEGPTKRVAWIAQNFVWQFGANGGEEQVKEIITRRFLERYLSTIGDGIEWNGGPPTGLLMYQIVCRREPYVALVKDNGQLKLVIDRLKLAEQVARLSLRHQLE